MILEREGFSASNSLAVYIGDDLTDESVFRKLRGISIAVRKDGSTAASFRLDSSKEVHEFLERWKKLTPAARDTRAAVS
jgi:trehalose-phosphatase